MLCQVDGTLEEALSALESIPPSTLRLLEKQFPDVYDAIFDEAVPAIELAVNYTTKGEKEGRYISPSLSRKRRRFVTNTHLVCCLAQIAYSELLSIQKISNPLTAFAIAFSSDLDDVWVWASCVGLATSVLSVVEAIRSFKRRLSSLQRGTVRASGEWRRWTDNRFTVKR